MSYLIERELRNKALHNYSCGRNKNKEYRGIKE